MRKAKRICMVSLMAFPRIIAVSRTETNFSAPVTTASKATSIKEWVCSNIYVGFVILDRTIMPGFPSSMVYRWNPAKHILFRVIKKFFEGVQTGIRRF